MRSRLYATLAVSAALLLAGCTADADPSEDSGGSDAPGGTESTEESAESITRDEVAEHDSSDSCWAIIEDTVYDLTSWISRHPGGPDAIRQLCGQDGTELFTGQHGDSGGPRSRLEGFELAPLED